MKTAARLSIKRLCSLVSGASLSLSAVLSLTAACDDASKAPAHVDNPADAEVVAATPATPAAPVTPTLPATLTPDGGRFTIAFPPNVVPTTNDQKVKTDAGEMTTKVWLAEVGSGVYLVNYTDMPAKILAGSNAQRILGGGRDGALRTMNGTLLKEERYTVRGAPGIRFWYRGVTAGTTIYGRTDALFASPRVYQIQYLAETESALDDAKVKAFFDSFELVGDADFGPKRTTGPDGRFSIALPASFPSATTTREEVDSPAGKITLVMMTAGTAKGAVNIGYSDLPGDGPLGRSNFDGSRDGMLRESGATLDREEDFAFEGRSARRVWFSGESQGQAYFGRADLIADGRRLYMIQAMTPSKAQLADPQLAAFFGSFKLLETPSTQK